MDFNKKINAFITLGKFLEQFSNNGIIKKENIEKNDLFFDIFQDQINLAYLRNSWFTKKEVLFACESWSEALKEENITTWLAKYNLTYSKEPKNIAIIMAGNIPLVGFHDFLSVLITGNKAIVKQSSNDNVLLPILAKYLQEVCEDFKDCIVFTDDRLPEFDAVIATGSNNTARYFEYYFKNKPSIIRKNRNSVAVLNGNETEAELRLLGEDIFRYYGLGCRNVSKLYVPEGYDFKKFFESIFIFSDIINEQKYANNYDYNKAVYLMSQFKLLENGFLMLKKDESFSSPIATLFYEEYADSAHIRKILTNKKDDIQCIVGNLADFITIDFGKTQKPQLWDYADNVDTVDFLLKI
ncbi:acyl-CoA reductase [Neptunitalea lumnitzerae]|uniref:long-chain-fatty-acyl-CoA reductase n=1 Tax=Neptunitalea lumnitzerae TaxID=2965509 RepID=A0ABQ5MJU6_9FLAO|nr:acyl-CoA reductase [Neptunitalea sp. Y10]GLB49682.1 acyl-CoA reductase [Neptunitalea sp. Y10]